LTEREPHNPYPTEAARQRAKTVRLVILLGALAGVVFGLALAPYLR
jgi:hypothetical protein